MRCVDVDIFNSENFVVIVATLAALVYLDNCSFFTNFLE